MFETCPQWICKQGYFLLALGMNTMPERNIYSLVLKENTKNKQHVQLMLYQTTEKISKPEHL
jgi:hypothetical protein